MGYKLKPNKSVLKRFRVTKTGKLKRGHSLTSHLMSGRSAKKKRKLGRPGLVSEGLAGNMRRLAGVGHLHPNKTKHDRALAAKRKEKEAATTA